MFKKNKKKNTKSNTFDYCLEMFQAENRETQDNLDFNSTKKLYRQIKEDYLEKIKKDNEFICIEKIRLEQELGKYTRDFVNTNINFYIAILSALSALLLQDIGLFNGIKITVFTEEINSSLTLLLKILVFFAILWYTAYKMNFDKLSKSEKRKTILYNIKLRVLEDIEKEMKASVDKFIVNDEIAATVPREEQFKHMSQQANGNWNVSISTLSIIDTFECIYKVGKFAKKIFKKKN